MKKRIIPILIIFCLLIAGNSYGVYSYAESQNVFYIRHVHTGDANGGTGCYTSPIYHVHKGPGEGECYTPIYHTHEGSSDTMGGCYTVPVLHYHTGDASSEGGCYVPKYHEHTKENGCYTEGICQITAQMVGARYETSWCGYHGEVGVDIITWRQTHHNCGAAGGEYEIRYCTKCGNNHTGYSSHTYDILTCTIPADTVEGYVLGCGHEEGEIDHYDPGCNMEGTIIGYDLTCTKTSADIDGYDVGCGMNEGDPVARVVIDNDGNGQTSEVNVSATIEDLSGGTIDFGEAIITWHDEEGNNIGSGDSVVIEENGKYNVEITFDNPSIDQNSLRHEIVINTVYVPGNEADDGEATYDTNKNEDGEDETGKRPKATPLPLTLITLNDESNDDIDESTVNRGVKKADIKEDKDIFLPTPEPVMEEKTKEETGTVLEEVVYGNKDDNVSTGVAKNQSGISGFFNRVGDFIKTPAGKIITISAGTILGAGVIILFLYLLRNTVIVLNDDTERKRHVLGILRVRLKDEGYCIEIPEGIYQRAYTGRYAFFMGLFMIGKNKDTQILIIKDDKRVSVKLSKIMETII